MMSIRKWIRRHKKALFVAGGVVGIGYVCYQTIKAHYSSLQEREALASVLHQAELRAEAQLQLHFQSVQWISDSNTLPSILPHVKNQLLSQLDLSSLTEKLIQGKAVPRVLSGKEKIELWQELKILSFTLAVSSTWALMLLVLFVRVQLNILARHVYIDTARDISTAEPVDQTRGISRVLQRKYLAFAEFLPHQGLELLISDTKTAVEHVLASKPLKEPCTLKDLREIFESIGKGLKGTKANWLAYMLPKNNGLPDDLLTTSWAAELAGYQAGEVASHDNEEKVESLLMETRGILDSREFREVLTSSFNAVLDLVMEEFDGMYQGRGVTSLPFAKLLPPVASIGASLLEQPDENRFVQLLTNLPQLHSFCAMVYSVGQQEEVC